MDVYAEVLAGMRARFASGLRGEPGHARVRTCARVTTRIDFLLLLATNYYRIFYAYSVRSVHSVSLWWIVVSRWL
jgi:hypothetical protein